MTPALRRPPPTLSVIVLLLHRGLVSMVKARGSWSRSLTARVEVLGAFRDQNAAFVDWHSRVRFSRPTRQPGASSCYFTSVTSKSMYPSTVPPFSLRLNTIVSTSEASDICFDGRLAAEQLFPTSFELDMPPMGHVLALRLPVSSESQDPDREWDLSILLDSSKMDTVSRSAAKFPTLLHPKELDLAMNMSNLDSRLAFLGGRLALRRSLRKLPQPIRIEQAVLRDEKGAPALPSHVQASISHKQDLAICLLRSVEEDPNRALSNIGVDIEICQPRPSTNSIATRVLTRREQDELGGLASLGISGESELLLRFSLKESVYKAIYPFLRRYVAFQEAEVTPHVDGTSTIVLLLKGGAAEGLFEAEGHWQQVDNGRFFLTAVWVRKVEIRS